VARIQPVPGTITVRAGTLESPFARSRDARLKSASVNWTFEAWIPASFDRLLGRGGSRFMADHPLFGRECPPPRLDVWLSDTGPDWSRIRVPTNVAVLDLRAGSRGYSESNVTLKVTLQNVDGSPLPRGRVVVETNRPGTAIHGVVQRATVDGAGVVVLSNLPPGSYRIGATASGFVPRVIASESWPANAYQEFTTQLAPGFILRGNVTDTDGAPLIGAVVGIRHAVTTNGQGYRLVNQLESTTNPFGQFELNGVPEGGAQLTASMPGYLHRGVGGQVPSPCPTNIVLQLEPTGTLEITVVDRSGRPVVPGSTGRTRAAENVFIQEADRTGVGSWGGSARIDTNSQVRFTNVPVGSYRISTQSLDSSGSAVRLPGARPQEQRVTIAAGQTNQVRLVQP